MVAFSVHVVGAVVGLVAKDLLNHDRVHTEVVHAADLLAPVVPGELANVGVPVPAFFFAPVHDAYPGAIDGPRGANGGRQHQQFALCT